MSPRLLVEAPEGVDCLARRQHDLGGPARVAFDKLGDVVDALHIYLI